ncbi:SAM-dependent methyltransferase [Chitinivibrio alkaliphilus]|uniref:Methyltransferase domain family n=1 Tax=Chitinivibrio alkaliphilus ACht1 TaxID=1313304 RepID=U7D7Y2_9BACT|nr:class I SAM-dependent methyltransferase [Chitinivibrio alkaliphilus]ERP32048.1 Methyltransferase domain family [Chitinivibrio alkaliphilus ACht1]
MVTDLDSNYTSPAGKEFSLVAGRFACISPASSVLDAGCGYGEGVCNIADEFRCKAVAVDLNEDNIRAARQRAEERKISHLIQFESENLLNLSPAHHGFDLILAEGGILSLLGRETGLSLLGERLAPRGWLAFSDLILLTGIENIPREVLHIYENSRYHYENEASYRKMITGAGFDIQLMTLVPPSGWDNYYAHMARRLEDNDGMFADPAVKKLFHREIDIFYRLEGFRYIGYLFGMLRKKSDL